MSSEVARFEEGQLCPITVRGTGGGLSFSPNGDMLLLYTMSGPGEETLTAWTGKWRAKLFTENEFPAIPIFAVGSEDWILEAPCNPSTLEKEAPGFCEALYAKEDPQMMAILVDADTNLVKKIHQVSLDEMFIERLVLSWNPFRFESNDYNQSFSEKDFSERVQDIFKLKTSKQLWMTSW